MQTQRINASASVPALHAAMSQDANQSPVAPERSRFLTIAQAAEIFPFSQQALRDIRFKSQDRRNSRGEIIRGNGSAAAGCWLSVGGKVLLDADAFTSWLASHKDAAGIGEEARP